MMLLATFPPYTAVETIRRHLLELNTHSAPPLDIVVQPAEDALPPARSDIPPHAYVLTATGRDRIGFVASVSGFCARHHLNILDLATAVSGKTYSMILLVDLGGEDVVAIRRHLQAFGLETDLRLILQHYTIFKATNEVSLL
jgi:predicted amino acid-binding ACT domain protein